MSRNLLNFSNEVLVDMDGFNYNLMTEETENVPQEKKFSYNQPINIEKIGAENIDFAFNRYNKNIRSKLKNNIKIYNDRNEDIIKNTYVDGFHNYKGDISDYKKYRFNLNFHVPEDSNITDLDLKLYENKKFITGWGGFDDEVNVKKITNEQVKEEDKIDIGITSNANNEGRYQGGFNQNQIKENIESQSKAQEVEITKNTPLIGGFPTELYYKDFGKSDKNPKVEVLPEKTQIKTVNNDKIQFKKKRIDFTSAF